MSNFTDFISTGGGGGGSASYPTIFLHNSQTWVPPQDGNIMIHVIGAGGSGVAGNNSASSSGAAGGYCRKNSLAVTTSGSFTVVIGAGGPTSGFNLTSNAGGNTTVAGTGLASTLTANGGGGGNFNAASGAGGTATGGDVNNAGGTSAIGRGGGAVGLTGTGNSGGGTVGFIYSGGDCDVIGDFWSSSFGNISGSLGSKGAYFEANAAYRPASVPVDAGPLAGGGSVSMANSAVYGYVIGGAATIGGGGGFCDNSGAYGAASGRGGEGCVVIQYIP